MLSILVSWLFGIVIAGLFINKIIEHKMETKINEDKLEK